MEDNPARLAAAIEKATVLVSDADIGDRDDALAVTRKVNGVYVT
jgi:hypothetical protein